MDPSSWLQHVVTPCCAVHLSPCLACCPTAARAAQERTAEVAQREESLEAWKAQFKAEAVRQIAEREALLTGWQARLERRAAEVEDGARAAEVGRPAGCALPPADSGYL